MTLYVWVHGASSGHPGGSLGCADLLTLLYSEVMELNPDQFDMNGTDEDLFFLSNGHISPVVFRIEPPWVFPRGRTRYVPQVERGCKAIQQRKKDCPGFALPRGHWAKD